MLLELKEEIKEVSGAEAAANIFRSILLLENEVDRDKEHFWAIGLDNKNFVLYVELVSLGTLNCTLIHPREVFRMAIMKAAARLIVGHNHPSLGRPVASPDDRSTTERLRQAGKILQIEVIDHIIIGNNNPGYVSFQNEIWDKEDSRVHHQISQISRNDKRVAKAIKSDKKIQAALEDMKEAMSQFLTF